MVDQQVCTKEATAGAEIEAALAEVASLSIAEQVDVCMHAGAADSGLPLALKVEYYERYIGMVRSCIMFSQSPLEKFDAAEAEALLACQLHVSGWQAFSRSRLREQWGALEKSGFAASLQDSKNALRWANAWYEKTTSDLEKLISSVMDQLKSASPPMKLLLDPKLLTDPGMQAQVLNNPGRENLNPTVRKLASILSSLKDAQGKGLTVSKELKQLCKEAGALRADTKLALVIGWAMDQMMHHKPVGPEAIQKQGEEIHQQAVLTNTWARLPKYLTVLVDKMRNMEPAAAQAPAAAGPEGREQEGKHEVQEEHGAVHKAGRAARRVRATPAAAQRKR